MQITQRAAASLPEFTAGFVIEQIKRFISKGPTLLLLSGGSVAKDVAPLIFKKLTALKSQFPLRLGLVDERFGPVDHKESNMLLLKQAGIGNSDLPVLYPLTETTKTLTLAVNAYETALEKAFTQCQPRIVMVLGMGPDAHIAGIKPQPTNEAFERIFSNKLVTGYEWTDFVRLTVTPTAIAQALCVVYAVGGAKKEALQKMQTAPMDELFRYPAILLRNHPRTYLLTDQSLFQGEHTEASFLK